VKIDHAISSYRGNRPTNKQIHKQTSTQTHTQKGPITIHCTAKLSAQCNYLFRVIGQTLSFCVVSNSFDLQRQRGRIITRVLYFQR